MNLLKEVLRMELGDKVRVIRGFYKDKEGYIDEIIKLEIFEDVIMVNWGDMTSSFSERELEIIN